jgi:hypothetical protein
MCVLNERTGWDPHLVLRNLRVCVVKKKADMYWSAPSHTKRPSIFNSKNRLCHEF